MLVDAGYPFTAGRLLGELRVREVRAHALTHAHADHAGGSKRVCEELGVPLWCPAGDVEAARRGWPEAQPRLGPVGALVARPNGWPKVRVDRELREGDELAGFTVLETPGHTPGHVALWREADRVLIAGDVWFNLSLLTTRPGLHHPPWMFTPEPARNRESMRRLAALEPAVACFGHGPVLHDAAPRLRAFVDAL